jgi:hypothetical protein
MFDTKKEGYQMRYSIVKLFYAALTLFALAGCGGEDTLTSAEDGGGAGTTVNAALITLETDKIAVASDGSDSATITATVLDDSSALVSGALINFTTTGGQLTAASVVTDENGEAVVQLAASAADATNSTVTVTASITNGPTASIPVQITGSTVDMTSNKTLLVLGGDDTATITATALDAGGNPVNDTEVTLSYTGDGSAVFGSNGSATATGQTDISGVFSDTLQGTSAGTLNVTASALGATSDVVTINVEGATTALQITKPTNDPITVQKNGTRTIEVTVPAGVTEVTFVTSHGTWDGGAASIVTKAVAGGTASAVLSATTNGVATVNVFDAADSLAKDSLTAIFVDSTVDANSTVTLQATITTVPPSSGDTQHSTKLTAEVKNDTGQPIYNAPVYFTLDPNTTTGGGEYIDPPYALTGTDGTIETTFYSGSKSSDTSGVRVIANLYDPSAGTSVYTDAVDIIINQSAGSVVLGTSSTITTSNDNTAYQLPVAVLVADSAGNPAAGKTVTLRAWPKRVYTGYRVGEEPCPAIRIGAIENEDTNKSLSLDTNEDLAYAEGIIGLDLNADGDKFDVYGRDAKLTPHNSTAGSLPSTVTTDENGVANFNLTYLKQYASWAEVEIIATTQTDGTETQGSLNFVLRYLEGEGCNLNNSPFNPPYGVAGAGIHEEGLGVKVPSDYISASGDGYIYTGDSTNITAVARDANGPVEGVTVNFAFSKNSSGGAIGASAVTNAQGEASVTYTAGAATTVTDEIAVSATINGHSYSNALSIYVSP